MIAAARSSTPVQTIPAALHPLMRFKKLPRHGILQVLDAVDQHEEFRDVVVELIDDDSTSEPAQLFLKRPEGWVGDLDSLLQAEVQSAEEKTETKRTAKLEKRLEQVQQLLQSAREEIEQLADERGRLESHVEVLNTELRAVQAERDQLRDERKTTIGQLKQTEDLARQRLQRVRDLEAGDKTHSAQTGNDDADEMSELRSQLVEHQQQLVAQQLRIDSLNTIITTTVEHLQHSIEQAREDTPNTGTDNETTRITGERDVSSSSDERSARTSSAPTAKADHPLPRTGRRIPVRLQQGLHEGTVEGARQLISSPRITLIDGYNVTMKGWPKLDQRAQRDALIGAAGNVAKQTGGMFWLVFDGIAEQNRPSVTVPLEVRVFFSAHDQEADDLILDLIDELDVAQSVVVVSSDRRVQDGARQRGASVIRSDLFLTVLGVRSEP